MARVELFIWWTSNAEVRQMGATPPRALPDYVKAQYEQRFRWTDPPAGRLWVAEHFGVQAIQGWPVTLIAAVARDSGGIVFSKKDLSLFTRLLPGMVTDFQLRMLVVSA